MIGLEGSLDGYEGNLRLCFFSDRKHIIYDHHCHHYHYHYF